MSNDKPVEKKKYKRKPTEKRVTMRLYRRFDLDLISLANGEGFSIGKTIKKVLIAYTEKKPLKVICPDKVLENIAELNATSFEVVFKLDITKEKEKAAYELLETIKGKMKNSFLKSLLRASLEYPTLSIFFDDPATADERSIIFMRDEYMEEEGLKIDLEESIHKSVSEEIKAVKPKRNEEIDVVEDEIIEENNDIDSLEEPKSEEIIAITEDKTSNITEEVIPSNDELAKSGSEPIDLTTFEEQLIEEAEDEPEEEPLEQQVSAGGINIFALGTSMIDNLSL